ncbi:MULTISPECIES: hypothetical protein [Streptomyces]|uniref:Uncharacterized protein n=1 Tax=Streptomyces achromogenes TaxID=67255 RepID=A0ABU0PTA5_STRAH|nr:MULTISPECIES: hypothetical protein [Streptomyces]MDQ0681625.1 hypothetical protein [Streptomyces achromogenes]MDQ0828779.1 hypothetical protein [Streptomyces achromogenes]MDQ0964041.1 hypothetical protein [Streptomyces sp. B4I13]
MNEAEFPRDGRPVDMYLDLLRVRMDSDDYQLLLEVVAPALRALDEQRPESIDFALDPQETQDLPQEIRDEAALVIATAVTGRLDNQLVEIQVDGTGPVRVVTDAVTASDPSRLAEIAGCIQQRQKDTEALRGIAAASGMPTDF